MTTTSNPIGLSQSGGTVIASDAQRARARNIGISYVVMAAVTIAFFVRTDGDAVFALDAGRTLTVAATPVAWIIAVTLAALGGAQLVRGFGRFSSAVLVSASVLFMVAFLCWAVSGHQTSLTGLLAAAVKASTPLTFGAIAGIICERSGIINIAIEALLLAGAFTSTIVGSIANLWVGVAAAVIAGMLVAALLAWISIRWNVDQVIAGFAINFLILGLTSFLANRLLTDHPEYNDVPTLRAYKIPLLHSIPVLGAVLFEQTVLVYSAFVLVAVSSWFLFHTRWGLRTRAIGEYPRAADTLGVDVIRMRYQNVIIAGAIGGFGGAFFTADTGRFVQNETAGRGFIALAALIFGRWQPVGAMWGALVFAFFEALNTKLSSLNTGIPGEFLGMAPYLATIIVVAGIIGRSRAPAAEGKPYESQ
jgi:simple sugar transport system permease protein